MLKIKKKSVACKFCGLDEVTLDRIKDIGRFLEYSEAEVIKLCRMRIYVQDLHCNLFLDIVVLLFRRLLLWQ